MKFLCIGRFSAERMNVLPEAEVAAVMDQCRPHMKNLYASDQLLVDVGVATESAYLERRAGKIVRTDGMADGDAEVGSVFLIEADDFDEAVRIAALHPTVQVDAGTELGWRIEIRPVQHFQEFLD
jgi:hypothetical protein